MTKRRHKNTSSFQNQAWGAFLLAIAVLIFVSVLSFSVNDPVHLDTGSYRIEIKNWLGPFGAAVSYYLMQWTLGYPIIVLPVLMGLFAVYAIQRKNNDILWRPSFYILIWAVIVSIFLAMPKAIDKAGIVAEYYPSGLIGGWLAGKLVIYLGKFGSLLTLSLITFVLAVVTIRLELKGVFDRITFILKSLFQILKNLLDSSSEFLRRRAESFRQSREIRRQARLKAEEEKSYTTADIRIDEEESLPEIPKQKPAYQQSLENIRALQQESATETDEEGKPLIQTTLDELLAGMGKQDDKIPENAEATTGPVSNQPSVGFEVEEEFVDEEIDYDRLVRESVAKYEFPSIDLLKSSQAHDTAVTRDELKSNAELLEMKLLDFGVKAKVIRVSAGPVITLYELQPAPGVKVSSIVTLANDLALALEARGIRIIAPIPGKAAVGIEIPNRSPQTVYLKQLIKSEKYSRREFELPLALGKTINGESYITDLTKMPHLLIAGSTGSGKSVGINTIIMSILYSIDPGKVKFLMIDPKKLELSIYRDLREHYLIWRPDLDEEVVTKPSNAVSMLNSIVLEMEKRYEQLASLKVRSIVEFNRKLAELNYNYGGKKYQLLPYVVVIIDELADLMMVAAKEVETPIARLAQMARAVGIHLIVATQRPSVDVITGMIKANFPARIAYQVATKVDSRTVLDMNGAEQLLGNGDMLFLPPGYPKPIRLQNPFISTEEVETIIKHISKQEKLPYYSIPQPKGKSSGVGDFDSGGDRDPLYEDARAIVVQHQQGSISFLQRRLKIGYSRAARLMDELEEDGIVGAADGSKPREVLITLQELQQL